LAHKHGALFILDEMITGFRWHVSGAQAFFGVEPDLATFGKAMANGFSLAAVVGKREFMEVGAINKPGMERTFLLSSTHGGEMPSLGAFVAAAKICANENVPEQLWDYGNRLKAGIADVAAAHGLSDFIQTEGPGISLHYVTRGSDGLPSMALRTLLAQELLKRGVMMPWISLSTAHGSEELALTLDALNDALPIYRQGLETGTDDLLLGPAVKPVFRAFN